MAVISTSFPRDPLTTDPQCMSFRPKKGDGVAFLQMVSALAIFWGLRMPFDGQSKDQLRPDQFRDPDRYRIASPKTHSYRDQNKRLAHQS